MGGVGQVDNRSMNGSVINAGGNKIDADQLPRPLTMLNNDGPRTGVAD